MTRPPVTVVMPFAGDAAAARAALEALLELRVLPGDELILADNSGLAEAPAAGVEVVRAPGEQSPAHARNVGAEHGRNEWILFLDADCRARPELLDAYFEQPIAPGVGALAGEVLPGPDRSSLAARYGSARSFLGQSTHLAHPYMPRAVAANLLVRRVAFEQVGGFYEGLRAAEDTDFSWRLQRAGWALQLRAEASVEHRYRSSVGELRAQWRGYAAGRAWLRRRYPDFTPQPALRRALGRLRRGRSGRVARPSSDRGKRGQAPGAVEHARHLALDAVLGVEELAGFALSNRPRPGARDAPAPRVVLVADRFPSRGDPLVDYARTLWGATVEARARPEAPWLEVTRELPIAYREDDGAATRLGALVWVIVRHPWRAVADSLRRRPEEPRLRELAPAARRLARAGDARVHALGGEDVQRTASRLACLLGRELGPA